MDLIRCFRQLRHEVKYGSDNHLGWDSNAVGINYWTGLLSLLQEGLHVVKGLIGKKCFSEVCV